MKFKGSLEALPDFFKLVMVFTFFLTMMLVSAAIAGLMCSLIYDVDFFANPLAAIDYTNGNVLAATKLFQLISAAGTFIVTPLIAAFVLDRNPGKFTGISVKPILITLIPVVLVMFTATPFINYLVKVNSVLSLPDSLKALEDWMRASEDEASKITDAFLKMNNRSDLFINLLIVAVIPAIGEELMFRGVIQTLLKKMFGNIHVAILFASIFFSAMHLQFFGFLPRMALGMVLGFLFEWSSSLWLPILAHFVNNASAVIFYYIASRDKLPFNQDTIGADKGDTLLLLVSVGLSWAFLFSIKKWCEKNNLSKPEEKEEDILY
ncbi:MAG: CPBP family intramembrane glutamic endopeptidase [Bacteroidia bacterium]